MSKKIINEWDYQKTFTVGGPFYKSPINKLSIKMVNTPHIGIELHCISQLFPNYLFKVYRNDYHESFHIFQKIFVIYCFEIVDTGQRKVLI